MYFLSNEYIVLQTEMEKEVKKERRKEEKDVPTRTE